MLKVELHAHTNEDPSDRVPHDIRQLIDHAAALGYRALAVTLHDRYFDPTPHVGYARERGIVLLPGIERTISRRHVLLVNFARECGSVRTFDELARLKARSNGLVIAPHPFYPTLSALGNVLNRHAATIDAVEVNAMYTRWIDFNRRAITWARAHERPLVGNSDLHRLVQMGTTYSLVDAAADPDAICEAIRHGRVEVRTEPLAFEQAAWIFGRMLLGGIAGRLRPARWLR